MISNTSVAVFLIALFLLLVFFLWSMTVQKKRRWLHKLYLMLATAYASWILQLIIMRFIPEDNRLAFYILDCLMQPGGALCAPLYLCIAVTFVTGRETPPRWFRLLFVVPILTILIAWTNPLHHLYYQNFSVVRSEIVFGPYIIVSGLFSYIFLLGAIVYMVVFGLRNKSALYWKQFAMLAISGLCPLAVSMFATFSGSEVPITATPMSFMVTLVLNGIAIFQLNMLDIVPIATQHVLDAFSDGYIVLSEDGIVIKYNRIFEELFARRYGITENKKLIDCIRQEDGMQKSPVYSMLSALESGSRENAHISYEQTLTVQSGDAVSKKYFVVDLTPLVLNGRISGFVIVFKDVTQLRDSLKRLQDSQERMLEQERFAFLGQMIGGLAHNLKTPIMSISGCISAAEALVDECTESLDDPEVTKEDYLEIYGEMRDWFAKVRESTAYMSDIITAIKGQATNIGTDDNVTFTIEEMLKRSMLLMRHELLNSGCRLKLDYNRDEEITLQGDINNLVQVIGNLLSNAIYAQKEMGGGEIEIRIRRDEEKLDICVMDRGSGIPENVQQKLFKSMITSKGTMGTGLGLYISNAVIRSKFNGEMRAENREGGGSTFVISIPAELVNVRTAKTAREG